jgi:aminoglycoside phosphotransferase (APT) family kinase protein
MPNGESSNWLEGSRTAYGRHRKEAKIQQSEVPRAVAAAMSIASALDLTAIDAVVLRDSNKLALRLLPCDVLARVAHVGQEVAQFEVELAQLLAETQSPVATLESRVEPRIYERDGFVVTLWTYYESVAPPELSPAVYADALERLHAGMRTLDIKTPHFTDRVAEAQQLVASRDRTPALADADRELLRNTLRTLRRAIEDRGAPEQLLHGEPHPGNVLSTKVGLRFIDLETCCRGPIEFDLAHVPEEVSGRYPDTDQDLLRECRILVLAMVAAWRWDPGDQLPNGQRAAREFLRALREGPPWPALDIVMRRLGDP